MDKRRLYIFMALVLALVLIAVISLVLTGGGIKDSAPSGSASPTESAQPSSAVTPSAEESTSPSASPTVSVSPTVQPIATAEPTPTPSAQPTVTRTISESGSFESSTGTKMIMYLNWTLVSQNSETATLRVNLSLSTYTLSLGQRSGVITVAGVDHSFTSPAIDYESELTRNSATLADMSFDVTVPVGQLTSIPVSASWSFNGTYGGTEIAQVTAGGTITVQG